MYDYQSTVTNEDESSTAPDEDCWKWRIYEGGWRFSPSQKIFETIKF
jgi:hypothetical protein